MEEPLKICVCGDSEDMHVDGQEQCFHGECGCREFEEEETAEEKTEREKVEQIRADYPNISHGPGSGCPIEFCSRCREVDESIN